MELTRARINRADANAPANRPSVKAGVPRISFHGLRHTHATLLMKRRAHPKVVSERLGHADITLTLQTYSHVLPRMQQEAADIFAETVAETM